MKVLATFEKEDLFLDSCRYSALLFFFFSNYLHTDLKNSSEKRPFLWLMEYYNDTKKITDDQAILSVLL